MDTNKKKVKVIVLGDIGRSPRMQYHAVSLAEAGLSVNIIGYLDCKPIQEIIENDNIAITKLHSLNFNQGPKILQYFFKTIWQFINLLLTLLVTGSCDYVISQNPPAIPTLPTCWLYCFLTKSIYIIDWHNYGFSIMALSLRSNHPLLKLAKKIEMYFGQLSHHNLCVTRAMQEDLDVNCEIRAKVLYDRPPQIFKPLTLEEKHEWFYKLSHHYHYKEFGCTGRDALNCVDPAQRTALTEFIDGKLQARLDRPGILFSSTSWTADEDFSILLNALDAYEQAFSIHNLPKLICVITGKGPMKDYYLNIIKNKKWNNIKVVTPWLEAEDYPKMVGSADLGVCLHMSSSGLDLPMKVVDMFGAGLPVCAYDFNCLNELVKHGENGYVFKTSDELGKQIIQWFKNYPINEQQNIISNNMKRSIDIFRESKWEDNWNKRVKKFFVKD